MTSGEHVAKAFEVLGLTLDASAHELRRAYAEACRRFHPDRHATATDEVRAAAADRMRQVNEAYTVAKRSLPDRDVERHADIAILAKSHVMIGRAPAGQRRPDRWAREMGAQPMRGSLVDAVA